MTLLPAPIDFDIADKFLSHRLERIEPELVALRRIAFCGRTVVKFDFGNTPFRLRFMSEKQEFVVSLGLQLRVGPALGWLLVESFDVVGEEWADIFGKLDSPLVHALLIEEVVRQFEQLARASGAAIQLLDLQVGGAFFFSVMTQALRIENEVSGVGVRAVLCAESPEFFARIATVLETKVPLLGAAQFSARLPVQVGLGVAMLRQGEIRQSRPGDIFIFPTVGTPAAILAVCLDRRGRRLPMRARLEGRTGRLFRYEGEVMVEDRNEMAMAAGDVLTPEEIRIPVTAVIGEIELPMRDFGALHAGYVFELPNEIERSIIRLYSGNRCVGTGRLVAIGERLGVRLVEWGGTGDGESA